MVDTLEHDDRLEFLGQVASWYYEDDLDQSEIASRIGKSRSMVSRLLREARDTISNGTAERKTAGSRIWGSGAVSAATTN